MSEQSLQTLGACDTEDAKCLRHLLQPTNDSVKMLEVLGKHLQWCTCKVKTTQEKLLLSFVLTREVESGCTDVLDRKVVGNHWIVVQLGYFA